jgi:hypothetical protein
MKTFQKILLVFFITTVLISCRKDEVETEVDKDIVTANFESDYFAENDIASGLEGAQNQNGYTARTTATTFSSLSCSTIQLISGGPNNFPLKFKINFVAGCVNSNGITRSGSLIVELSDYVTTPGSTMKIERENYYVNTRKVEGTITYLNQTTNPNIPTWKRTVTNGKITKVNGDIFSHSGLRIVKLMNGAGTTTLLDNIYHIMEGTHTIQRPNGTQLTATINETLVKPYTCHHITQGKLGLQGTFLNGVLDYGNGTCDNQAVYTHSNGNSYNITL